jgi:cytochrome b561
LKFVIHWIIISYVIIIYILILYQDNSKISFIEA